MFRFADQLFRLLQQGGALAIIISYHARQRFTLFPDFLQELTHRKSPYF
jgi:hypothetical protein